MIALRMLSYAQQKASHPLSMPWLRKSLALSMRLARGAMSYMCASNNNVLILCKSSGPKCYVAAQRLGNPPARLHAEYCMERLAVRERSVVPAIGDREHGR